MYNILTMEIVDTFEDLTDNDSCIDIYKTTPFVFDEREQVSTCSELLEDVYRIWAPEDLLNTDYVWMNEVFKDFKLSKTACDLWRPLSSQLGQALLRLTLTVALVEFGRRKVLEASDGYSGKGVLTYW